MSSTDGTMSSNEVRDYLRAVANAPRYLHVVCLRCGLIVDRRRKATDLRTPEELYERVMCGNCCARSVLGEVIFSFDGGGSFYAREVAAVGAPVSEQEAPGYPENPTVGVSPIEFRQGEWSAPVRDSQIFRQSRAFDFLRQLPWAEMVAYTVVGLAGLGVLAGLRLAIFVFAGAVGT